MRKLLRKDSVNNKYQSIISSKIQVSDTHFEQYVKHAGANLERKELCYEEKCFFLPKNNKSRGYDGISSNVIKSVLGKIFYV